MFDTSTSLGTGLANFFVFYVPVFLSIIAVIALFQFSSSLLKYAKNRMAKKESHYAKIIGKTEDERRYANKRRHYGDGAFHTSKSARLYRYITLEFENGATKEFLDTINLSDQVEEGDYGYATVQGEWILSFERTSANEQNESSSANPESDGVSVR